jgi:cbb3-type cytochrome oxidase subunit 3
MLSKPLAILALFPVSVMAAEEMPQIDPDPTGFIVFLLLCLLALAGTVWFYWNRERKNRQDAAERGNAPQPD